MKHIVYALMIALVLGGCSSTVPVRNIDKNVISSDKSLTDIESIIESAAKLRGWQISDKKPGEIEATLLNRSHKAVVIITYNKTSYAIHLKDAQNLDYNPSSGKIHRNYNKWIEKLNRDISSRL